MRNFVENFEAVIMKSTKGLLVGLCFMAVLMPSYALAEGYGLQDWSSRGGSLAGGLVARGGDASAVAYNPAAITELSGTQIMTGIEFIMPTNTIETYDPGFVSTDTENLLFIVPHAYVTHKYHDQLSFGLGIFSRFGLGNEYDENWVGNQNMYHVELLTSTINPVVAWRFNDSISVAAGIEFTGAKVELKTKLGPQDLSIEHDGIEYAVGFNLATHYRINEEWKAGLTYRSGMEFEFNGVASISPGIPGTIYVTQDGTVSMSLPDQLALAVAYTPFKALSFEAQIGYYVWSAYESLDLEFSKIGTVPGPKNWKDTWLFSLSTEYQALDWLTLRAGISHETSPVPALTAEYMTPTNGRWKYTLGLGFQKDNWTLDASYIFYDLANAYYTPGHAAGVKYGQSTNVYAQSFGVSFGYKF